METKPPHAAPAGRAERAALFARALRDPDGAQRELLLAVLRANANTEYGRAHGFSVVADLASYRAAVPVVTFAELERSVVRMLAGEPDVLSSGRPIFFGRTSGTSGRPKHVGYPAATQEEYLSALDPMLHALERDHPAATVAAMVITGRYREDVAPCGTPVGSASGFVRNLPCFAADPYFHFAPECVLEMTDFEARYYAMLRLALASPLRNLSALNPSTLLTLFQRAEQYAEDLAADLERGTLERGPTGVREVAQKIASRLRPEIGAAARLRSSIERHGRLVPAEVWPDLRVLQVWKGGASDHYLRALRERCPGCAIRSAVSGSTEGLLLVPLADDWVGGVPALRSSVIEFFPADQDPSRADFSPIAELAEGQAYRVLLTNRRGMYRYQMDDVFLVEGRVDRTPVLRYSHRHGLTSSLTGEKLTEADVASAAEAAVQTTGLRHLDFQALPEWGEPPRYLVLVEWPGEAPAELAAEYLLAFEAGLAASNVEYTHKRQTGRLAPPELLVLAAGEFERMRRAQSSDQGRSDAQVKIPRLRRELADRSAYRVFLTVRWPGPG